MIDKNSSMPMYEQIAQTLGEEILNRKYGTNGCLGTQSELAARFGVSLITIRKAMQLLNDQNLIDIRQGKGTFVHSAILKDDLTKLTGVSNILAASNLTTQILVPVFEMIPTPRSLDDEIYNELGEQCLHILRVHTLEGAGFSLAELFLPQIYGRQITKADIENYTIYQIYQDKLGVPLGDGLQTIRANKASSRVSKTLGIQEGSPVLEVERKSYSAKNTLIEYMIMTYEYSRYSFQIRLKLSAI